MFFRVIIFFLFFVQSAWAQQSAKYSYSLGAEVSKGFIYRNHEYVGHLIQGKPTGVELSLQKKTYGAKAWEANYGYPDVDFKLSYYDLGNNEQLGQIIAISSGMAFHLLGTASSKNELQFYFGMGVGYATNPYNKETNNLNNVVSSKLSYNGNLKLAYHHNFGSRVNAGVGIKITHYSNGSAKLPNIGLNLVSLNVMTSIRLNEKTLEYKRSPISQEINSKIRLGVVLRMGWAESAPAGSGVKPVYGLSLVAQKRVSLKSLVEIGLEGFANKAIEYEMQNGFDTEAASLDYRRAGFMFGHELIVNKLVLVTQLGIYLYKPYYPNERLYTRLGLSYYFTDNVFLGFSLKTHYAVAEVIEYSIGFRL